MAATTLATTAPDLEYDRVARQRLYAGRTTGARAASVRVRASTNQTQHTRVMVAPCSSRAGSVVREPAAVGR